jgi:hypothetical protein
MPRLYCCTEPFNNTTMLYCRIRSFYLVAAVLPYLNLLYRRIWILLSVVAVPPYLNLLSAALLLYSVCDLHDTIVPVPAVSETSI